MSEKTVSEKTVEERLEDLEKLLQRPDRREGFGSKTIQEQLYDSQEQLYDKQNKFVYVDRDGDIVDWEGENVRIPLEALLELICKKLDLKLHPLAGSKDLHPLAGDD